MSRNPRKPHPDERPTIIITTTDDAEEFARQLPPGSSIEDLFELMRREGERQFRE
jgi:hypothetical protein